MTKSIPASALVQVTPGVLGAGGNPLSLNMVMLTQDTSIPIGTAQPFTSAAAVSAWFGPNAPETLLGNIYFSGFINSNTLPGTLWFAQYNTAAVGAYLRGASVSGLTLAQIQALSGTIIVTVDGRTITTASINLSAATSLSNAATIIQTALQAGTSFTGTGSQAAGVVTIATVTSGTIHVGDILNGAGVEANSTVNSLGTGTGGVGTYNVSTTGTVALGVVDVLGTATASYDSQRQAFEISSPTTGVNSSIGFASGTLAPLLFLTSATGANTSQGAIAATPAGVMASVVASTQNWATFMTVAEVVDATKLLFAAWVTSAAGGQRYAYVCQDSNAAALTANASGSFGALTAAYNGVVTIYDTTGGTLAAFFGGATASIDFTETAGRITYGYKSNASLVPQITDETIALNLQGNGYNYYASYATAAQQFQNFQPGLISGNWDWADEYINQIYLNSQFQLALMELLTSVKSLPYNTAGFGLVRAACQDPITSALNFGSIQSGVALSAAQAAEVNTAAGVKIDSTLQNTGWYLQILPATAMVRGARTSPPMTFWYTDGGSIQKLNLASIDVQ